MQQIPYRNGMLASTIDYEKLIEMQAAQTNGQKVKENNSKRMVKSKAYENKRIHRGGKR
ncbi:MAG: hypothetical protein J6A17_04510 [Bacilli bacterium]|nr:hypothetical protein [Bacilli bacterium]